MPAPALIQPRGIPARMRTVRLPAPLGGINTISAGSDMPLSDCNLAYNLIGAELGLRARLGWREWATGLASEEVRSLLPFNGSIIGNNRLFAVTQSGIWDVSASTQAPTRVVGVAQGWISNADAGWGVSTVFVTAAGHFLCYTDEANGYWVYSEASGTWTAGGLAGTPITGVNPANLVFVMPWKNRLWFVEKSSARAWYLGLNAVTGAATSFTFGARFKYGGDLRGLWSWTGPDGGVGFDDQIVAVSGGGDVVTYKGTDPSSVSTFGISGVQYAGAVPAGRRFCTDFGGDLLVLSSLGILPLSRLMSGIVLYDRNQYQTAKIANLWNQLQGSAFSLRGWAMRLHPLDAALIVLQPTAAGQPTQQLVMSLTTKGWSQYRDMPLGVCAEPWGGSLYFGTEDGRVCVNDGYVDGVLLANPAAFNTVNWSLLSAFSNMGAPIRKRVSQIRVKVLSQGGAIPLNAEARYNFDLTEAALPISAPPGSGGASTWDDALWDVGLWAGAYQVQEQIFGTYGHGMDVGVAIRGSASSRMTFLGADVFFDAGGPL